MSDTQTYCRHCLTPREPDGADCCSGAEADALLDLLAAFRGKRPVTADDIAEAETRLADWRA